jgi:hypothetical protein
MDALFQTAKELALPRVWSAGVELARNGDFQEEGTATDDERQFRVIRGARDPLVRVSLSESNELWQCDCGSDEDPCVHVVGTIIAVRQGLAAGRSLVRSSSAASGTVMYSFSRSTGRLSFSRSLVWEDKKVQVVGSLAQSIELATKDTAVRRSVAVSKEEMNIDHVLGVRRVGVLEPKVMRLLLPVLARIQCVELDGQPLSVSGESLLPRVEVFDEANGFRVRRTFDLPVLELFENGAVLCGTGSEKQELRAVEDSSLSADEWRLLAGDGAFFPLQKGAELASQILPALSSKVHVENRSRILPKARRVLPHIAIETISDDRGESLTVVPHLVYGDPPIAEATKRGIQYLSKLEVPVRDPIEEARLTRDLMQRLGLALDEGKQFTGEQGVLFSKRLSSWKTFGKGKSIFTPAANLSPQIRSEGGAFSFEFKSTDGSGASDGVASFEEVYRAWQKGSSFLPLLGGSWGAVPTAWLASHGDVVARLLAARNAAGEVPAARVPELVALCEDVGVALPDYFSGMKRALSDVSSIPDAVLPADLTASLRSYQRIGVNWLSFLRSIGVGGMLADDMGLGKTVQAISILSGRSLIVAPTSVLYSWEKQLKQFRPNLSINLYYGTQRSLRDNADVTLTTYTIARIEVETLSSVEWDTLVLDEAQTIRNPEAQITQAVHKLRGKFRVSLSGTPVENSLQDLWSQFQFLNPGLLGSRSEFEREIARPVADGDKREIQKLRTRVQPFTLRRLKREVAKDLPPKTEVVVECELTENERRTYEGILLASRGEVLRKLESGEGVFSILEVLLRLRQACCHTALIPGCEATSSSKIELLVELLNSSIEQGHRALVFSQWTSLLDLVEPHLERNHVRFSRIDGGTSNRAALVEEFQAPDGPDVMLLSLKAGGLGITLTAADHIYILDPWWNPAVEDQASDRAHRIGQENPVLVHRLVARDSIEERIMELQNKKRSLLSAALGEGGEVSLSRDELLLLLE